MSDIHINTGSDFFGRIAIKDIHGKQYLISERDEIRFFIRTEQKTEVDPLCIVLTCDDEIMGKYSFRLESEVTEFVSSNKKGVVTSNFILVGTRDHERTIIRDGHITLNGDGSTLGNVMIGCENINIEDQNGNIIGSFFKNLYGGTTLKINELYVDNAKYTPANITVNGITYTALCSNVNT